jgi:transposase
MHLYPDVRGARIEAHARQDDRFVRLRAIIGIGLISAGAAATRLGNAHEFKHGWQIAAWLGLVSTQHFSGEHVRWGEFSCHGDASLGMLLIQSGSSSLQRANAVTIGKTKPELLWIR